jgi:molybdate transport system regulatory protein
VINIGNEDKVVTVITTSSIKNMNLKVGSKVDAIIKASDIMIGR